MPQSTVATPETDTCWSITPQGRAALDAASAPTDAFRAEVLHGLAPDTYAHAYATGWHADAAGCPWWGGALEVAWEDGRLDRQRGSDHMWTTPLLGYEGATR
ncbi:hypothetical protein [Actinomyces sp.]|uniref:hypothetical protein n=1 Tax=Actinomyces sp. TaxID=29317 RepID=UPI0028A0FD6B|nr:hypothetical protein [Actinomyces sp.]